MNAIKNTLEAIIKAGFYIDHFNINTRAENCKIRLVKKASEEEINYNFKININQIEQLNKLRTNLKT